MKRSSPSAKDPKASICRRTKRKSGPRTRRTACPGACGRSWFGRRIRRMSSGFLRRHRFLILAVAISVWSAAEAAQAPPKVTSPNDAFGFAIGDDYQVAGYTQLEAHWKKLA